LQIGLANLDRFTAIGAFSGVSPQRFDPASSFAGVFKNAAEFNRRVPLLWMGAGTAEPERILAMKQVAESLRKAGVDVTWFEAPGLTHEWQTWRLCLRDFAPRLFRD